MRGHPDRGHEGRWEALAAEAWLAARRGRHAQALRMCRAAAVALERREQWSDAARASLTLARLHLERGDSERALAASVAAEGAGRRTEDADVVAAARLWRAWSQADLGAYGDAVASAQEVARGSASDAWRAAAWGVSAVCGFRQRLPQPVTGDEPANWPLSTCDLARPLVLAAWAVRVECLVAGGQLFRAGCAVAALRESAGEHDISGAVEAAIAHVRVVGATGDARLVTPAVAEALRLADTAHLPWARLRTLALWRDVAGAIAAPEAGVLRARVRRVGARAPAGWRDAVADDVPVSPVVRTSVPARPTPQEAGGRQIAGLIGDSEAMRALRTEIIRAARTAFPVLIEGETGTGKELVARGLHALSARATAPFRDLNCAALTDELIDAELFGHARGAFTGAVTSRAGLIEDASGGTLFLDEVADLSPRAQAKLLRVFQEQEVRRVGETHVRAVDIRLVAACNRALDAEAAAGRFRPDLLYRMAVIRIRVPPLRARPGDVALIVQACWPTLARQAGTSAVIGPEVFVALERYAWPGNVRELQHVLATLAVRAPAEGIIRAGLLPEAIRIAEAGTLLPFAEARDRFEGEYVREALARHGASPTRAAQAIGLSRQGLRKVLARTAEGCGHAPTRRTERDPAESIE